MSNAEPDPAAILNLAQDTYCSTFVFPAGAGFRVAIGWSCDSKRAKMRRAADPGENLLDPRCRR